MSKKFKYKVVVPKNLFLAASSPLVLENYEKQIETEYNKRSHEVVQKMGGKISAKTPKAKKIMALRESLTRVKGVRKGRELYTAKIRRTTNKILKTKNITVGIPGSHARYYASLTNRLQELGGPEDQVAEIIEKTRETEIRLGNWRDFRDWVSIMFYGLEEYLWASSSAASVEGTVAFAEIYRNFQRLA